MIRIGCVQFAPAFKDVEENVKKIKAFISDADADLLIFPELALSGYFFTSKEEAIQYAETTNGISIEQIKNTVKETKIAVVIGFLEIENNILYNSAIAIDCNGEIVGHYRKVHLFYYEKIVFAPGNLGFPVCNISLHNGEAVMLGMQICY